DAIELTIGQGAKPGTGGLLLGSKVSDTIAKQRDLPVGVDQRSPARHPDMLGPDDMIIKIDELREATDFQLPIFVKMGASRVFDDVKLAAKAGADVVVVDGMEGGTGASPAILQEHTGIPTLAAVCEARERGVRPVVGWADGGGGGAAGVHEESDLGMRAGVAGVGVGGVEGGPGGGGARAQANAARNAEGPFAIECAILEGRARLAH